MHYSCSVCMVNFKISNLQYFLLLNIPHCILYHSMIFCCLECRTGMGRISACGGDGYGGGGGGRVSVDIFSRHDDPKIFVHG